MKNQQSRVFHLQIEPSQTKKQTEKARVTLIDHLHKGCFSRKNTRSLEQIRKEKKEDMFLTGVNFFFKRNSSLRRPSTGSRNPSLACSTIFSKRMLSSPTATQSCYNFPSDSKPRANSQPGKTHIYNKIKEYNKKMISQVYCFEEDQGEFSFKRETTPKTHWDLFRFEQLKKREKTKGKKEIGQKKRWEAKRKGFNCLIARKKMQELESQCQFAAWQSQGPTEEVEY